MCYILFHNASVIVEDTNNKYISHLIYPHFTVICDKNLIITKLSWTLWYPMLFCYLIGVSFIQNSSTGSIQSFWNIYNHMWRFCFYGHLRLIQSQILETLLADTQQQVPACTEGSFHEVSCTRILGYCTANSIWLDAKEGSYIPVL